MWGTQKDFKGLDDVIGGEMSVFASWYKRLWYAFLVINVLLVIYGIAKVWPSLHQSHTGNATMEQAGTLVGYLVAFVFIAVMFAAMFLGVAFILRFRIGRRTVGKAMLYGIIAIPALIAGIYYDTQCFAVVVVDGCVGIGFLIARYVPARQA